MKLVSESPLPFRLVNLHYLPWRALLCTASSTRSSLFPLFFPWRGQEGTTLRYPFSSFSGKIRQALFWSCCCSPCSIPATFHAMQRLFLLFPSWQGPAWVWRAGLVSPGGTWRLLIKAFVQLGSVQLPFQSGLAQTAQRHFSWATNVK